MTWPTRCGRWGVTQIDARTGESTGGGTINIGYPTEQAAKTANPESESYRYRTYERWPADHRCCDDHDLGAVCWCTCKSCCAIKGIPYGGLKRRRSHR